MRARKVPVGFDRAAQPGDRLFLSAELKLGLPGEQTPKICIRVAGTEAQRLLDVSLGLLGLAELNFAVAYLSRARWPDFDPAPTPARIA